MAPDSGDDDAAALRERVDELEQTVDDQQTTIDSSQEPTPSRRGVLAALTGVAGAGALGAYSQRASAQAAGQVGTSAEPVDVEAWSLNVQDALAGDLDAGGNSVTNVGAVEATSGTVTSLDGTDLQYEQVGVDKSWTGNVDAFLDQNDSDKANVDDYLNNQVSNGEIVVVETGTHTCSQITLSNSITLIMKGTIQPDGDHTIFTLSAGDGPLHLVKGREGTHFATGNQDPYTSDAVKIHDKLICEGTIKVQAHGDRAVLFQRNVAGSNLNHSNLDFELIGTDSNGVSNGNIGLLTDEAHDPNSMDINDIDVWVRNARDFTKYGIFLNSGSRNRYWHLGNGSNDVGIGIYAGDHGTIGTQDAGMTHNGVIYGARSDGSNTNADEHGSTGLMAVIDGFQGKPSGLPIYMQGRLLKYNSSGMAKWVLDNPGANGSGEGFKLSFHTSAGERGFIQVDNRGRTDIDANEIIQIKPGAGYTTILGRPEITPEDLSARNGNRDGEIGNHDGSGTPGTGLYRWDSGNAQWEKVEDNTVTI